MNLELMAQFAGVGFSLVLIARLLLLRLHRVYRIFCAFLLADVFGSLFWFVEHYLYSGPSLGPPSIDYRIGWLFGKLAVWVFTVWTVYALLGAILANLHGVRRFSRSVLNWSFGIAILIGLASAIPEYMASGLSRNLSVDHLQRMVGMALILDRVISSTALLALLCVLCFLLWFPVEISRNLAVFVSGFVVYFAAKTSLLLGRSFWSYDSTRIVSIAMSFTVALCLAYWGLFISAAGEKVRTRLGHLWRPEEQDRLMGQLEAINASLLRASRGSLAGQRHVL